MTVDDVAAALDGVVAALPGGGEARDGQRRMALAVAAAVERRRHLVVQAGTGTGKTLGYLVPVVLSGRRTVIATATKALQDQLADRDLPFLQRTLGVPFDWAVLKGRSNYLCLQRAREVGSRSDRAAGGQSAFELDDVSPAVREEVRRLIAWSGTSTSGDRAELSWEPSARAWQAVSVSADECPGATRCPMGEACFAEAARRRAGGAQVVVVNTHLYGLHLASGGALLPEHDVLVVDEAHQLEEIVSATAGVELGPGRFASLARAVKAVVADDALVAKLAGAGTRLAEEAARHLGQRLPDPAPPALAAVATAGRLVLDEAAAALRAVRSSDEGVQQRLLRAHKQLGSLADDLDAVLRPLADEVAWVEGSESSPLWRRAPLDVGGLLAEAVWPSTTAVLTSATVPPRLAGRIGLPDDTHDELDVGSPFDYATHGLLYCAMHLPDPRHPGAAAAMHDELAALIDAAGGRTLALFTSWSAMRQAAEALSPRLPYPILTQADLPKPALVASFSADERACLFATAGFFQGVDIPGRTLSLVVIDRIPFPRPDEPLLAARRERAGAAAFRDIDLPRAATLLAQAAGRLIRTADDRGVVAVLDRRLATASYRWDLVRALPPMRRTRHRAEAESFLRAITGAQRP